MYSIENTSGSDCIETRISLAELNNSSELFSNSISYSYGILTLLTKSFASIKPAYFAPEYEQRIEYDSSKIVIFDPSNASFSSPDKKIQTQKYVYIIRYVARGTTVNAKTGETQPTIDYSIPLEILLEYPKDQCLLLTIDDSFATVKAKPKTENSQAKESEPAAIKDLDEATLSALISLLNSEINKQGFVYAANLPQYLYKVCGTKEVKRYASNISEFVKKYLFGQFTYEPIYYLNEKKIPGVILPCWMEKIERIGLSPISESTRIDYKTLETELDIDLTTSSYRVGVVNYCDKSIGFINRGYKKNDQYIARTGIIFDSAHIKTVPEGFIFNTSNFIYLVLFAVSGTTVNPKTGITQEAIDLSIPIRILHVIPKKQCSCISIQPDSISIIVGTSKDKTVITEEIKAIILSVIKERIISNKGSIRLTEVPVILDELQEYGISREIYKGTKLQSWIKTNFPELIVAQNTDGTVAGYIYLKDVTPDDIANAGVSISEAERFKSTLIEFLRNNSSVSLAALNKEVFMPNGLDIRFFPFGKSIEEWLSEQVQFIFSEDKLSISLSIDYIEQIHTQDAVASLSTLNGFTKSDADELDRKFKNAEYAEFLSSDCFRNLKPTEIPFKYMEKAFTAARRLIFGFDEKEVHLNAFQRKLLTATSNNEFSEWEGKPAYNDYTIHQCLETMLFSGNKANASRILGELIHKSSRADTYLDSNTKKTKGLVSRFQTARNEQTLPLYVIAAFAQDSQSNIRTLIADYCRFVLEINRESGFLTKFRGISRALHLSAVLKAIILAPYAHEIALDNTTQTLILSVFVDTYATETLEEKLAINLFPTNNGLHRSLIDLIKHHESWNEEVFINFIVQEPSMHLFERCIALIWGQIIEKNRGNNPELFVLPNSFLRLLSWIITHCDRATLEAVIDFPTKVKGNKVSHKDKWLMMLRSLPAVQRLADKEDASYNLGAYLSIFLFEEAQALYPSALIEEGIPSFVSEWIAFSQRRFEMKKHILSAILTDRKAAYAKLFKEYWIDAEHELILQRMFDEELFSGDLSSLAERKNLMTECLSLRAYITYCHLYQYTKSEGMISLDEDFQDNYVNSLIQIEEFKSLIDYLMLESGLSDVKKNRYLTKAICGVFGSFHYTPKSFSFFDDRFTEDDAKNLLQKQIATNNPHTITPLIAIYIHQNELIKARYLYEIFHSRAELGNTRIYLQFESLFDSKSSHVLKTEEKDNHYNVLQSAFYTLTPHALIQFLLWASEVKIPAMANYNPQHAHILALSNILKDPSNTFYWQ